MTANQSYFNRSASRIIALLLPCLPLAFACGADTGSGISVPSVVTVNLSAEALLRQSGTSSEQAFKKEVLATVTLMEYVVTASDIDPVVAVEKVTAAEALFSNPMELTGIPTGEDRTLTVTGYTDPYIPLFTGSAENITINQGKMTEVQLDLTFNPATLRLNFPTSDEMISLLAFTWQGELRLSDSAAKPLHLANGQTLPTQTLSLGEIVNGLLLESLQLTPDVTITACLRTENQELFLAGALSALDLRPGYQLTASLPLISYVLSADKPAYCQ
jgi:hypothetical protein